jgi:hypothetical protein
VGSRIRRLRDVRRHWEAAELRVWQAAPGSPDWDAAQAQSAELERSYMKRISRILDWTIARRGRIGRDADPET